MAHLKTKQKKKTFYFKYIYMKGILSSKGVKHFTPVVSLDSAELPASNVGVCADDHASGPTIGRVN